MGEPVVVVVPPASVADAGGGADTTTGVAAIAAIEQAGENAVSVEALRALVERVAERFALEITAITERVDALSEILISAMEELDLEEEDGVGGESSVEDELETDAITPLEEEVVELSDTANTTEEAPEASERHPDVAGGTGNESGSEGSDSGADASERSERRAASKPPKPRKLTGPFARHQK